MSPRSLRHRYSPCTLPFLSRVLPLGAHFHVKSAMATSLLPEKARLEGAPRASSSDHGRSSARVDSHDSPARQLWLSPMSPPVCANTAAEPAPLVARSVPGKLEPLPTSAPSSKNCSIGAIQRACSPSLP